MLSCYRDFAVIFLSLRMYMTATSVHASLVIMLLNLINHEPCLRCNRCILSCGVEWHISLHSNHALPIEVSAILVKCVC